MLALLNVRKSLIISLIVILLDGLLVYLIPSYFNKLSFFYPMLTISLIPFIYYSNKKNYYFLIIVLGSIYDLLYSSIFLYNVIIFIVLIKLDKKIIHYFKCSLFLFITLALLNIIIYDSINFILVFITNYNTICLSDLIYKIDHSIILNIMSVFVFWFLFKKNTHHA